MVEKKSYTEKETALFAAVTRLAASGRELHGLRVSEIAAEAGIGKGTVYEYFKSKEALIGCAMLYNLEQLFACAEETLNGVGSFREGFFACVGMVRGALERRLSAVQMLVSELRRGELETYLGDRLEELEQYRSDMDALIGRVVSLGETEGLFGAADPWEYRCFVFGSAVASCAMAGGVCLRQGEASQLDGYAYEMLLRALRGPREERAR
ncbi:TetR/AcrR family transcriptional regulator [Anaerofilum sp. BX8]|uniref:TetR/AcrR family transcriptional regulator n=1 Tax=Anaerofilum hominis TaxID=2763016 RepID=A0A923KXX6_9FIRM|nr:TetR/AcrR family transcriptional regulator [Anaerofilum hominis]